MLYSLQLVSDFHAELMHKSQIEEEVLKLKLDDKQDLILAGDIGNIEDGSWIQAVRAFSKACRDVYVVFGNHEFYTRQRWTIAELKEEAKTQTERLSNVFILDREQVITKQGVHLVGCTLWSNPLDIPHEHLTNMNDFRYIYADHNQQVDPYTMMQWNAQETAWLEQTMLNRKENRRLVVVTHFAPLHECNPLAYANSPLISYFCNELPKLVQQANVWLYGHVHGGAHAFQYNRCNVVRSCVGYQDEPDYNPKSSLVLF